MTPLHLAGQPTPGSHHLDQLDLAHRWRISPRTLERWRWRKIGPAYVKIGNRVVYLIDDVLSYEAEQRRDNQH